MSAPPKTRSYPANSAVKYRSCNCERYHRTPEAMAKCIWKRRVWLHGTGRFACVAYCGRGTSVQLSETLDEARIWKSQIDAGGCGSRCSTARHRLVEIILPTRPIRRIPTL